MLELKPPIKPYAWNLTPNERILYSSRFNVYPIPINIDPELRV